MKPRHEAEFDTFRVVSLQIALAVIGALIAYATMGSEAGKSAFFGGMVAAVNGFFHAKKLRDAERIVSTAKERALLIIYGSAVARFILTLVLFGLAFGYLKLMVLPALVVFAIGQLAYGWGLRQSYKDLL